VVDSILELLRGAVRPAACLTLLVAFCGAVLSVLVGVDVDRVEFAAAALGPPTFLALGWYFKARDPR